ncbi:putative colanic acid biosynthesis acetyltransferase [Bacteroides ovatus]|nr:putative colanic acid biosynthesis acetyltransferase [Bacteroides ovatus]MBV3314835.1 putative colanic acid biosynthesis acetyltransferase [Bacteroides ovatus]MCS2298852.1 putative colanic acid biosynthesis acetyltransferase [Bacteroides ovatus]
MKKDLMGFKTLYSKRNKFRRLIWSMVWTCLARPFPRSMAMGWKRMLLRAFWAKIASTAAVYAIAKVFQSWLLAMDDYPCLAEGVDCYNTVPIRIGRNATVSQRAFLCTSGHDITDSRYHQANASIVIEDRAWVCAEAFVGQGVTVGEGAVCAARAVVIKDVESWTVVGGESGKVYKEKDVNKYQQDTLASYFI